MEDRTSASGVPLLKITYPSGPEDVDYAHLKRFFNPMGSNNVKGGKRRMLDNCIFHGNLEFETDVYVTLTSGCPYENSFEVCKQITAILFNFHLLSEFFIWTCA